MASLTATVPGNEHKPNLRSGIVAGVSVVHMLDHLPEAVAQTPGTVWSVLARSLGEQGADGRTALAWRWALTGACPSPVTLARATGTAPSRRDLVVEAESEAQAVRVDADPGGQLMHARFVLQWLVGDLPALPLWNGGPNNRHVTDGVDVPRSRAEVDDVCSWALLAQRGSPRLAQLATAVSLRRRGQSDGMVQLLEWASGITVKSPLTRLTVPGRPSLYQLSLDVMHAMASLEKARKNGESAVGGRMEGIMEMFAWLAGWEPDQPVDRHGHLAAEDCAERRIACRCDSEGICLRTACPACYRVPCVHGFGTDLAV